MIRKPITKKFEVFLVVASILAIIGFYGYLSHRQHLINPKDTTIPSYKQIFQAFYNADSPKASTLLKPDSSGKMWLVNDSYATGSRLFVGLGTGILLSFLIGLGMGVYLPLEAIFKVPITFMSKIPPTAMLAVYFVLFGTDFNMYVAMVALGIFPSLAMAIYGAARSDVSDHEVFKAYTLGASSFETVVEVVIRKILPRIIENIRLVIGPAMVFLIAAEWMMADVGFGYRLRIQSRLLNMNIVYVYLFLLACFGFGMDWVLVSTRRWLCRWFDLARN